MAEVKKRAVRAVKRVLKVPTPKLWICGMAGGWCQIREGASKPVCKTTTAKVMGTMRETVGNSFDGTRERRRRVPQNIRVHVFSGGSALTTARSRNLMHMLGLPIMEGESFEVPSALVARVRRGVQLTVAGELE